MPATPDDLFAFLDRLGIAHATVSHPPLFTVEQSQALRGTIPGGHTKNLFLKDKKDTVFLVVAPEEGRVDLKTLHHKLGAGRFSFGSAELMRELLGVEPGAVTAFGVINDTREPRQRRPRRRPDGERDPQLSSAGQHHDHLDRARRPAAVFRGDRPYAADRAGAPSETSEPIAFRAALTHLCGGFSRVPVRAG